jgi:hypothetical protein
VTKQHYTKSLRKNNDLLPDGTKRPSHVDGLHSNPSLHLFYACFNLPPGLWGNGETGKRGSLKLPHAALAAKVPNGLIPGFFTSYSALQEVDIMGFLGLPQLRYHSPWVQNFISGIGVGASAGIYVALNLLGAGGGRPDSAQVVQVVNATLCAVWFFSSSFGGSILNKLGPGITMCIGVQTYAVYVGSLWYYDETGKKGYPYAAGPIIGIGAGMVFITAGYIATGYPEEREKGSYATILMNMQALGSVISGIIPVIINRNSATVEGVPRCVYISFIIIMVIGGLLTLLLLRPQKLTRDDGSVVAVHPPRGAWEELRSNLLIFTDPILLMMVPAFLPSEGFLVYSGSVNGTFKLVH